MDMDGKFHIHGNPGKASATFPQCTVKHHSAPQRTARHCNGTQAFRNVSAMHRNAPRSVCLSSKTAEWIWMPFGLVVVVGPAIGVLNVGGNRRRVRGSFERGKVWNFPL